MKRTTILALVYAILISMAAVSFSLYNSTVTLPNSVISSKVFDISKVATYTVDDTRPLETTPLWPFMVFRTDAFVNNKYNLNVQVILSTSSTTGLQVGLYDDLDQELDLVSFVGNTAELTVAKKELLIDVNKNQIKKQILTLKYFYTVNGLTQLVSASNIPFAAEPITSRVAVWGT